MKRTTAAGLTALVCLAAADVVMAQDKIERIKLTDNQMSCRQMSEEIAAMDKTMGSAASTRDTSQTAGTVAGVTADAAPVAAQAAAVLGKVPGAGAVGSLLSPFSSLFGGAARAVAQSSADKASGQLEAAKARKEYVAQLFTGAGCNAENLDAPPTRSVEVAALALSEAATKAAAPKFANVSEMMDKVSANIQPLAVGEAVDPGKLAEMFNKAPRVAVAGFRVAFVTSAAAQATAQSGLANIGSTNRITQAQNASIEISLTGIEPAVMQAIADRAYADFMDRLAKSGREIVPLEEVLSSEAWKELELSKVEPGKLYTKDNIVVVSTSKIPLWFFHGEQVGDAGMLALGNWRAMNRLSVDKNAVAIVPMVTIDFARVSSSGRTMLGSSAEVGAEAGMSIRQGLTQVWGFQAEKPIAGDIQRTFFKTGVPLPGEYGPVKELSASDNSRSENALTFLTGLQGVQRRSKKLAVQADPAAYAEKALTGIYAANAAFANAMKK